MTINLGLIGAGRIGRVHAESVATRVAGAKITAVADVSLAAAQDVGAKYGIPLVTADYRQVLAAEAVDAILICSATDTHAQIIIEAAEVGKHIFCEKPIDHSLSKIDAALAAVEQAGVKLMIGFNRRFDSNFAKIKALLEAGELGDPHILRITSRDPAPPPIDYIKVSGGIFLDMMIHDFDMARFLLGDVDEVYTVGGVMVDPAIGAAGDVDTAVVTLKFVNGALGTIDNSRQAVYGYDQRVELFGSKGMARAENNKATTVEISSSAHVQTEKPLYFFLERYMDAYAAEMAAFIDCVVHDQPSPISGQDGRAPVLIGLAAKKSLLEGRPVKVREI